MFLSRSPSFREEDQLCDEGERPSGISRVVAPRTIDFQSSLIRHKGRGGVYVEREVARDRVTLVDVPEREWRIEDRRRKREVGWGLEGFSE